MSLNHRLILDIFQKFFFKVNDCRFFMQKAFVTSNSDVRHEKPWNCRRAQWRAREAQTNKSNVAPWVDVCPWSFVIDKS